MIGYQLEALSRGVKYRRSEVYSFVPFTHFLLRSLTPIATYDDHSECYPLILLPHIVNLVSVRSITHMLILNILWPAGRINVVNIWSRRIEKTP